MAKKTRRGHVPGDLFDKWNVLGRPSAGDGPMMRGSGLPGGEHGDEIEIEVEVEVEVEFPEPPRVAPVSMVRVDAGLIAARLMLLGAVAGRRLRKQVSAPGGAVIVEAPSAEWVGPLAFQWKAQFCGDATPADGDLGFRSKPGASWMEFQRSGTDKAHTPKTGNDAVADALWHGMSVVGISALPEKHLPADLLRASDCRIRVPALTADILRQTIRQMFGRSATAEIPSECLMRITPATLRIARRPGQSANAYLRRVVALSVRPPEPGRPGPCLEDIHGMDEAKGWGLRVVRDLADYRAGRIAWDRMDTAALLHGAPGCGKTLFAEALAKSTGIPLIATSFSAWQSSGTGHLGDCLREMRAAFDRAKAAAPSILFIDELDAVGDRARADKGHDDYWRSVVTAFLELLDGIGGRAGVLVLGATNNPGALDPAILRSGRMNRLIEVRLPGTADIAKIIRYFLGDDLAGADLDPVARRATGASGADCKRFVRSAQQRARHAGRAVEMADLLDEIGGQDMPPQIERRVAVHESGHAVAAHVLRPGSLVGASIGQHAGSAVTEVRVETSRSAVQAELVGLLAGRAAEEVVLGDISGGCGGPESSDLALATCLAVGLDTALGLGGSGLLWTGMPSPRTVSALLACRPAVAARAAALLDAAYAEAVALVRRHRDAVVAVAAELQVRRALSGGEIGDLVSRHLPAIDCIGRMQ